MRRPYWQARRRPTAAADPDLLAIALRTVADHIADGMSSRVPALVVAAQSLASELALAGVPIDEQVDARLLELEQQSQHFGPASGDPSPR